MRVQSLFPGYRLSESLSIAQLGLTFSSLKVDLDLMRQASTSLQGSEYWKAMRQGSESLAELDCDTKGLLNFELCIGPMLVAAGRKQLPMVWEFSMRSLYHVNPGEKVVAAELTGPLSGVLSGRTNVPTLQMSCVEWAAPFYWLLRRSDHALDELGHELLPFLSSLCIANIGTIEGAHGACSILDWLAVRNSSRLGERRLFRAVAEGRVDNTIPLDVRAVFAVALSSRVGEVAGVDFRQEAAATLSEMGDTLGGHYPLQLRAIAGSVDVATAWSVLVSLRRDVLVYYEQFGDHDIARRVDRSALFDMMKPLISIAIRKDNVGLLLAVVSTWMAGEQDRSIMLCVASFAQGSGALWASYSRGVKTSTSSLGLEEVVLLSNRVLGRQLAVSNGDGFTLESRADVIGKPNSEEVQQWVSVLRTYYFDGVDWAGAQDGDACLVVARHLGHPLQPLMMLEWGWTLPLATCSTRPLAWDDSKRCVFFRPGSVLGAEIEQAAVVGQLESQGWEVEVIEGALATAARFLEVYRADMASLIWVSGHGEFDHYEPEGAYIPFVDRNLTCGDLSPPLLKRRRLLVLNTCDSGTSLVSGGLAEFSVAAVAAGPQQSVVAHQWPTDWSAAVLLGALLASQLKCDDTFAAYVKTLQLAERGHSAISAELVVRSADEPELELESVIRRVAQTWSFLSWGSLAYYG